MCGGYALAEPTEVLEDVFSVDLVGEDLPGPSWNIRPTNQVPVVVDTIDASGDQRRRLESARWSLIPSWVKDAPPKFSTFNARSEDTASKASWRDAVKSKRCLVPASGYYEWVVEDGVKVPHYIHSAETLAFAGLYSWWRAQESDPWMLTATILTMPTVPGLAAIHDRNPVPLPKDFWVTWLDPKEAGTQALVDAAVASAVPVAAGLLEHRVNPIKGNGPELVLPAH
ncbi:MAG: SOS response-associated peptidase [Rhodoluna sp.]